MRFGLIGESLAHSFSPRLHSLLADYEYQLFEIAPPRLAHFLTHTDAAGLNVTIPYKQAVLPYCSSLSSTAQRIGSVNTLLFSGGGRIYGHNTDYDGFAYLVRKSGLIFAEKKVLILGSGGTSRTVATVAEDLSARSIVTISRQGEDNYGNLERHADCDIIINATPLGMYPHNEETPLSLTAFPRLSGVFDVIYNPLRTRLVQEARARGITALGGLPMLVAQAKAAAELFCRRAIAEEKLEQVLARLQAEKENIVLIGMPGCGKSSLGAELSRISGRPCLDTDAMVEELAGQSIAEIFAAQGEAAFRAWERQAVAQAAKHSGSIIASGGGAPLSPQNCCALAQNGRFYLIERNLAHLSTSGRPLSRDLPTLYAERQPVYQKLAAATVTNNGSLGEAAMHILTAHEDNRI